MKLLPVLFFTLLLDTISIGILIPLLPTIFNDPTSSAFVLNGYSESARYFVAGAIVAVFGLMQFIAAPILGELSDVYGRKRLLTLGVALLAISNLFFGFGIEIGSLAVLIVARIIAGFAAANFSIAQAAIADVTTPENRAKNFGLIGAAYGIGFILGPLLGGFIASTFGHAAAPFWFAGMLGVLNVFFISTFLPETRKTEKKEVARFHLLKGVQNIRTALKDVEAGPVYLTSFLYMSGFSFFTSFVGLLLSVQYGFDEAGIGTFFGVVGLCIVITQTLILPRVAKRFKERSILIFAFPVVAICILLYPFMGSSALVYLLVPLMAVPQGLAFANISALISKSVGAGKQGAALGINGSLMALAQGLIPLIAGVGSGIIGLKAPFIAGAVLITCAWLVLHNARKSV